MEPNNHNSEYTSPTELPQPEEASGNNYKAAAIMPAAPESRGLKSSFSPQGQTMTPRTVQSSVTTNTTVSAGLTGSIATPTSTAALAADDADLIEKEWVIRAKAIVMQTKNDPYKQNQEMSHVKADYLKKRYNKDLKLNDPL